MRLLMFYEHKVREIPALIELKENMEKRGWECVVYSIAFEWYSAYQYARKHPVDVLVLPWCYGADQFWRFSPFIELNPDLKLVNMHHEQITAPLTERVLLPRDEVAKTYPLHLCWSPYFQEALAKAGVDMERTSIVGNLRVRLIDSRLVTRDELAKQHDLDPKKRWILFGESRRIDKVSLAKNKEDFVKRSGVSMEDSEAFFGRWEESLGIFIEQVKSLPAEFFDEHEFIYRPHPGSTIEFDLGPRTRIIFEGPISDWLGNCDVFVTWQSTSAFEAEIAGLPVLVHECVHIPANERMPGVSDYRKIDDLSQISDELIKEAAEEQRKNPVYPKYLGEVSDDVVERYSDAIEAYAGTRGKLEVVPYDKSMILRMLFFEVATKALLRGDLIHKLRWPNTALMMYEDIPFNDNDCSNLH